MFDVGLKDLLVFLLAAGFVVPAARRVSINPVLGFLAVGMLVGPYGLPALATSLPVLSQFSITNVEAAGHLAELGVVFLLFMIALELPLDRLLGMRRLVFGAGFLQVLVGTVIIGAIAYSFGNSLASATLIGGALALSSTAIVSSHLLEKRQMSTPNGQLAFGILLAQDLAVVPLLFLLGALGADDSAVVGEDPNVVLSFLVALLQALVAIASIVIIGRWLIHPLFRLVAREYASDVFMATTLLVITLTALLTHAAGMSAALGAFLAGLLLAETEYRHEIELLIEPLKGLLLGLFFISVGMQINLAEVANNPLWLGASVFGLLGLKLLMIFGVARVFGFTRGSAACAGLQLAQGGEFAFVILGGAIASQVLPGNTGQFMLIVVSATMVLTPLLLNVGPRVGKWLDGAGESAVVTAEDAGGQGAENRVVLVGFGRTGCMIADLLDEHDVPWLGLDLDAVRVAREQSSNRPLYLGDASRRAMLDKLAVQDAAAVVICTDDHRFSGRILRSVRSCSESLPVLMRVHSSNEGAEFLSAGATVAVPEVLESGLQLAGSLFEQLGINESVYRQGLEQRRSSEGIRVQDSE